MISPFVLHRPSTLDHAVSLLAEFGEEARILAGGTELILLLKTGLASAKHLIDIKGIPELDRMEFDEKTGALRIGGAVTHRRVENSSVVREHFPVIAKMERQVANVRVRNIGTIGGNLSFADPHADPPTLLLAHEAKVKARGVGGEKRLEVGDFFLDYYQTALEPDEIITEIEVPKPNENTVAAYLRFCPGERSVVAVAILMEHRDGGCQNVRLALGCVGPKPIRAFEVEEGLKNKSLDEISAKALDIGEQAALLCDPARDIWGSVEYKRQIAKTLVCRGLQELCCAENSRD